jgi:hypothetical protein
LTHTQEVLNPNLLIYLHENIKPAVVEYYYKSYLQQLVEDNNTPGKSNLFEKALAHQKPRFKKQLIRKVLGMHEADVRAFQVKKTKHDLKKIS